MALLQGHAVTVSILSPEHQIWSYFLVQVSLSILWNCHEKHVVPTHWNRLGKTEGFLIRIVSVKHF